MKRIPIIILLTAISPLVLLARESNKAERNLVVEGNRLFEKENYHAALEKYNAALATNPDYDYALFNVAVTLTKLASDDNKGTQNDPREMARQIFSSLSKQKSNTELAAKSLYNLGNMAFNDNQFGQAIELYKESLRINPTDRQCRQNLLIALNKQEEQEQNQDQQDQQDQQQQEQNQQEQQEQEQEQEQEQQPQPQQPQMTQSAEQLLQTMQNKENATRRRTNEEQLPATRRTTDKPW